MDRHGPSCRPPRALLEVHNIFESVFVTAVYFLRNSFSFDQFLLEHLLEYEEDGSPWLFFEVMAALVLDFSLSGGLGAQMVKILEKFHSCKHGSMESLSQFL
jgi:hypothetical protein